MKRCRKCKELKPLAEFSKDMAARDGLQDRCRSCHSEDSAAFRARRPDYIHNHNVAYHAKHRSRLNAKRRKFHIAERFNLTVEEYDRIMANASTCAICSRSFGNTRDTRATLDHCHAGGGVRDVLCGKCNAALRFFDDSLELLRKAVRYMESFENRKVVNLCN